MNKIYRKIWSSKHSAYVVVAECAKGRGKSASRQVGSLLAGVLLASGAQAQSAAGNALPTGAQVTVGVASIAQSGNALNIQQSSQRAAINWQSFNVGRDAVVNFIQPNSSASALNRVVGNERSVIDGAIKANGNVWVLNSAGVLFNLSARVDVGGLVATTLNMSDADFLAGKTTFESNGTRASVINRGNLKAANGGYVALLGQQVSNQGVITATLGSAMLAAGDKVSLNFNGGSLIGVTIDRGVLDALVENKQAIYADGGRVHMTTQALDTVLNGVVNNSGVIEAKGLATGQNGEIILFAHGGTVQVGGTLKAPGGFVETSGKEFSIQPNATIETNQWLIDPVNITIDSTLAASIGSALASGDVTVQTTGSCVGITCSGSAGSGDIVVSSAITKSSGSKTKLTLAADRDITVNAAISGSNGSPLDIVLASRYTGGTYGGVYVGANLKSYGGDITIGGENINATGYSATHSSTPYGDNKTAIFIDQSIIDATGDGSGTANNTLPTASTGGNISMRGKGDLTTGHQFNEGVYFYIRKTIGVVTGGNGSIYIEGHGGKANSHFWNVGAIGVNWESDNTYIKANTGDIRIVGYAGTGYDRYGISSGNTFIGTNGYLGIQGDSYKIRTGTVSINVGGSGDIDTPIMGETGATYALSKTGAGTLNLSGNVAAWRSAIPSGTQDTATTGTFTDSTNTVNLVNLTQAQALYAFRVVPSGITTVTQSTATPITPSGGGGGGGGGGGTTPSPTSVNYAFTTLGSTPTYNGGTYSLSSLWTAADLFGSSYSSWVAGTDYTFQYNGSSVTGFANAGNYSGITATILKSGYAVATSGNTPGSFTIAPKTVSLSAAKTYDGSTSLTGSQVSLGGLVGSETLGFSGATLNSKNVGSGNFIAAIALANGSNGGLATNYQLPTLNALNASATVSAKGLTVTGTALTNKTYDGTTNAPITGGALQGVVSGDTVLLTQGGTFADKNVGANKVVTASNTISGPDSGNYTLTQPTGLSGNIAAKTISINGTTIADKVYDGTTTAKVTVGTLQGVAAGDSLNIKASANFSDVTTGVNKSVQVVYSITDPNYSLPAETKQANIIPAYSSVIEQTQSSTQNAITQSGAAAAAVAMNANGGSAVQSANLQLAPGNVVVSPPAVSAAFGRSENLMVVSTPRAQEATALVSLGEARTMLAPAPGGSGAGASGQVEVRVPLSRGSVAEIVNGGVRLPEGVEQHLFVVQN